MDTTVAVLVGVIIGWALANAPTLLADRRTKRDKAQLLEALKARPAMLMPERDQPHPAEDLLNKYTAEKNPDAPVAEPEVELAVPESADLCGEIIDDKGNTCGVLATYELAETFREGAGQFSGVSASYCPMHRPEGAVRVR